MKFVGFFAFHCTETCSCFLLIPAADRETQPLKKHGRVRHHVYKKAWRVRGAARLSAAQDRKRLLDPFDPETENSAMRKYRHAILARKLCSGCLGHHGKTYAIGGIPGEEPPLHENCRCAILPMEAIRPGNAAKDGRTAQTFGWRTLGNCPITAFRKKTHMRGIGRRTGRCVDLCRIKCCLAEDTTTIPGICLPHPDESGMKQIYTSYLFSKNARNEEL